MLRERPDLAAVWAAVDALFPVRVTRSFWDRMAPGDPADPLAVQVLPDPRELDAHPGDLEDPVGDQARSPLPWVVQKHSDRVLLLMTKRCPLYCRYCFRRTHHPSAADDPTDAEWEVALRYAEESGAHEVILSGGDPLSVSDARLFATMDRLRPAVPVIRIHTRAPVTHPRRVTPRLVQGLRERAPVWVVVHANHPSELAGDVDRALARLVDAGIPVLNQSVLLRGVNDDAETLVALCEALVRRRVLPYYLHHPDHVAGNAHFRVSLDRGWELYQALRRRVSGVALPAYVIDPPDGSGKVPMGERIEV
jgi:lysine 2,3-aminomutase